ncbi:Rv3235 family protein [Micrococcus luteus]|uniref:Rv3235 family protein n=1 Tax=Micrococcus luteus TaxID=1270 RepID=UPI0039BE70F8
MRRGRDGPPCPAGPLRLALARGAGQVDPSHGAAGRRRADRARSTTRPGRPAPGARVRTPPGGCPRVRGRTGRVEASATVLWEGRARAFALRLERRLSRWKVTSVEIG